MTTVPGSLQAAEVNSLGARYFHSVCDRHHIGSRERSTLVEKLLDVSYHAAHRRVRGEVQWTLEELERVAANFGETLDEVVLGARLADAAQPLDEVVLGERLARGQPLPGATPALFVVGTHRARCQVWLGEAVEAAQPGALIAYRVSNELVVGPATTELPANASSVRSVLLNAEPMKRRRVAVLDDNEDIVASVSEYLQRAGFDASPFITIPALQRASAEQAFDAYVLDWLIGTDTVRLLIAEIRGRDKACAIAVLTGQIDSGKASPTEVAEALAHYGAQPFMKPIAMPMLVATLEQLLGSSTRDA